MTGPQLIALVKKNPISFGCGFLSLLLIGGIYFRSGGIPQATADVEQKSAEGERLASNIKNSAQLNEQFANLAASGKEIEARLVRAGDLAKNLQYFYKLESDTGTKLVDIHQNPPQANAKGPKTAFAGVGYSLTLQGDYAALVDFLRRLENGAHYCRVMSASLSNNAQDRTGGMKMNLGIELLGTP